MEPSETGPRCANQVHSHVGGERPEPTQVCSCSAGLIHMLDCPVDMGLPCAFFRALEGPPASVDFAAADELHSRLMQDYLSRTYYHRIRALAPAGDPWQRRREELYAFYATVELEGQEQPDNEEGYERERERLLGLRKEREAERAQRDEMTREEKAKERARLGIKTVVQRAQEAVALQAPCPVETPPAPEEGGPGGEGPLTPESTEPRRRRRRRRRRRSGGPIGPGSSTDPRPAPGPPDLGS
jgi:hypothetical protein